MNRAVIAAAVLCAVLAGVATALVFSRAGGSPPALERAMGFETPRPLPEFSLVDHAGRPFGPERLRGRWTFVFFGFANCPDVCPTTLAELAQARRIVAGLPDAERPEVVLVSVDPGRDTPELLAGYVVHFDPSFTGVTGDPSDLEALTGEVGVAVIIGPAQPDGSYGVDHSTAIFLVDPEARVAAVFGAPHEAGTIARDYRSIVAAARG